MLNQADHIATGRAVLDAVRDAGNRWVFPEQLVDGVEPWGGVKAVWVGGSPQAEHGVDTTDTFDKGVESLAAHAAYIEGLGWENWDPREFLEGFGRQTGQRMGVAFATAFEVYPMGWGGLMAVPHLRPGDLPGRVHRRTRPGPRAPARGRRRGAAPMDVRGAGASTRPRWTRSRSAGAYIMGRNMFGPDRGEWDLDWKGWWGDDPPYHGAGLRAHPPRARAGRDAGRDDVPLRDRRPRGGAAARDARRPVTGRSRSPAARRRSTSTSRAGHIDELRLHVAPIVLGSGEALFRDLKGLSLEVASTRSTSLVTHVTLKRVRA